MDRKDMYEFRQIDALSELPAVEWDGLLRQADAPTPFMRAGFLRALDLAANPQHGWRPSFSLLLERGRLVAACPLYLKAHSWGEFVFDQAWARAYEAHGLRYYPKALVAVPFTPVPGSRLLATGPAERLALVKHLQDWVQQLGLSGLHVLFGSAADAQALEARGFSRREQPQFHWQRAPHWQGFADFLADLRRDKRKKIQQERRRVAEAGVQVRVLRGSAITAADWDFFYACYTRTYALRGMSAYLPRSVFEQGLGEQAEWVLFLAWQGSERVAAALVAVDWPSGTAFGRHWGALRELDCLHFELCYYAPLTWCLEQGLQRFEGGAQGEHKMARGLLPVGTHSQHWLVHAEFQDAVARFTEAEQQAVGAYEEELAARSPFKPPAPRKPLA
ncbi:GNAT family N-acetyltransferase [Inhella sp.]|uniref:GNAT family N-acetyltransferase n=1 Tax=Inhella sp. TaxID=1921806 RepID=UPI0035AEF1DB